MNLSKKAKLAGLLKKLGAPGEPVIEQVLKEVTQLQKKLDEVSNTPPTIIEKTTIVRGQPGEPGKDATPLDPKEIIEKVRKEILPLLPQGGNLPGRSWRVNSSVVGVMFNDVNIVSPGATATNDITNKRTTLTIPGVAGQGGGIVRSISAVSASQTAAAAAGTDYAYLCSAGIRMTLPTAVGNTNLYTIKNASVSSVLVTPAGGETIDGSTSALLNVENISIDLLSNNVNWNVV